MNDPLDPLKRIQQHLEAIRRMQAPPHFNVPPPRVDASGLTFRPGPGPASPPEPLVDWLLEDLPPREFHDLVAETVTAQKLKGYRPGHVPRAEGLKLLKKRHDKDPAFRVRLAAAWLKGRPKEQDAFRLLKPDDLRKDPWPAVERFGFPMAFWLMTLSAGGAFRAVGAQVLKDVAAKGGKLEEVLAEARRKAPAREDIWALPSVGHDEELARIQSEVEGILAERDRWRAEAAEEKKRREALEAEAKSLRGEAQKAGQARSAAGQERAALEDKLHGLEERLGSLRGAESAIKRLEKRVKELEHEDQKRLSALDADREAARLLRAERDALKKTLAERERTLAALKKISALPDAPVSAPFFKGEVVLLVTAQDPAPFFESAKRAGLTLLVHDGRARNAQFDKFVDRAWRVVLWGEEPSFHEGVLGALEPPVKPVLRLPDLPASAADRVWRALT
jgi:hypothetical protein